MVLEKFSSFSLNTRLIHMRLLMNVDYTEEYNTIGIQTLVRDFLHNEIRFTTSVILHYIDGVWQNLGCQENYFVFNLSFFVTLLYGDVMFGCIVIIPHSLSSLLLQKEI